jgi:hypothetical protein
MNRLCHHVVADKKFLLFSRVSQKWKQKTSNQRSLNSAHLIASTAHGPFVQLSYRQHELFVELLLAQGESHYKFHTLKKRQRNESSISFNTATHEQDFTKLSLLEQKYFL